MEVRHAGHEQEAGSLDNDKWKRFEQSGNGDINQDASADTNTQNNQERTFLGLE
jgi:hypothetical protein